MSGVFLAQAFQYMVYVVNFATVTSAASGADPQEHSTALLAELSVRFILKLTAWAVHAACVLHSARRGKEKA